MTAKEESPKKDYAQIVEDLLKMPQELCKMCGLCCKVASFKGGMSYEEIREIANDLTNPSQADGAKDFLTIFAPIVQEEAEQLAPGFVKSVLERFPERQEKVSFYKCRFMNEDGNKCVIHEDRPMLCRMYPIPHERTVYHTECGFKEQGQKNWQAIMDLITELQSKSQQLEAEKRLAEEEARRVFEEEVKRAKELNLPLPPSPENS